MHIQKLLAVICVAALTSASSELYASDTQSDALPPAAVVVTPRKHGRLSPDDEAKMREQLRQTIAELNAKDAEAKPATPVMPQPAKPVTSEPAMPLIQPVISNPTPVSGNLSAEEEAKLREQLRQTIAELNAKDAETKPATPVMPQPAKPKMVEPAMPVVQPVMSNPTPVPGKLSAEDEAKVREQMRQAIAELNAKDAAARAAVPVMVPVAAASENAPVIKAPKVKKLPPADASVTEPKKEMRKVEKSSDTAVVPMPAAMAPGSKEQRLADLLQLYKTDKISPSEYHQQRAKIVSEP